MVDSNILSMGGKEIILGNSSTKVAVKIMAITVRTAKRKSINLHAYADNSGLD